MAGLQDIAPTVAKRCVTRAVRAPTRAAAAAASQPACPPPTTITSKRLSIVPCIVSRETFCESLPDTEGGEDPVEHLLDVDQPRYLAESAKRKSDIFGAEFHVPRLKGGCAPVERRSGTRQRLPVALPGDHGIADPDGLLGSAADIRQQL